MSEWKNDYIVCPVCGWTFFLMGGIGRTTYRTCGPCERGESLASQWKYTSIGATADYTISLVFPSGRTMKLAQVDGYEVATDGRTVWINAPTGQCVARYCKVSSEHFRPLAEGGGAISVTLHQDEKVGDETYQVWVSGVYTHYQIRVPEGFMPSDGA